MKIDIQVHAVHARSQRFTALGLALQFFWTWFLLGADACTSRLREVDWYTEALATLGFTDIRVIPGPFDLVVATR